MNNSCPNCCSHNIIRSEKKGVKKCGICGTKFKVKSGRKEVISEGFDILL